MPVTLVERIELLIFDLTLARAPRPVIDALWSALDVATAAACGCHIPSGCSFGGSSSPAAAISGGRPPTSHQ
jgi:hypothetical protein